ncbi:YkvA family protein [Fulvivirga sp.]|uniref:YkvA family protein n=1 Tax=Fulvivirga sp. TaxID=1931237 RepID=UPI0032EB2281
MKDVEKNKFFEKAREKASSVLNNNDRLKQLFANSTEKLSAVNLENFKGSKFVDRIRVLIRMVKAYKRGEYRNIKLQNILLIVAALVYFVTPLDLIPDFIPITGLVDDFTVIVWVYNKVQQEIDKFMEWENGLEIE